MAKTIDPTNNGAISYDIGDRFTFMANSSVAAMPTQDGIILVPLGSVGRFILTADGWIKDESPVSGIPNLAV